MSYTALNGYVIKIMNSNHNMELIALFFIIDFVNGFVEECAIMGSKICVFVLQSSNVGDL